jgi:hypothetical protein
VDAEARVGAKLRFGFPDAPVDLAMVVTALDEDSRVDWECPGPWPTWAGTRVEWVISKSDSTLVTFAHRGWSDDTSDAELGSVALVWAQILMALTRFVEDGTAAPVLG